jgi:hypothetical protein
MSFLRKLVRDSTKHATECMSAVQPSQSIHKFVNLQTAFVATQSNTSSVTSSRTIIMHQRYFIAHPPWHYQCRVTVRRFCVEAHSIVVDLAAAVDLRREKFNITGGGKIAETMNRLE